MMSSFYKQFVLVALGTTGDRVKILPRLSQLLGARERQPYLDKFLDSMAKICKNVHAPSPILWYACFPYEFSLGTPADVTKIQR